MTRDEGIEICITALNEEEDGSDAYFELIDDLKNLKNKTVDEMLVTHIGCLECIWFPCKGCMVNHKSAPKLKEKYE